MQRYISFLRGVNMAGHNSIRMTELALLFESLGFKNVITHIQSGNVVFDAIKDLSEAEMALKIESEIHRKFNYFIPVMIRTPQEIQQIILSNPLLNELNFNPSNMSILFLHDEPLESQIQKVQNINYPPDKFVIIGREIFIYCPDGFGKTKLYTNFFERKMSVVGTARNLNTVTALLNIAERD